MSAGRNPIARYLRDLGGGAHQRARSGERQILDHELDAQVDEWFQDQQHGREISSNQSSNEGELPDTVRINLRD